MKKLFVGLLLLTSQLAAAQSADERIGTSINEKRWFDLQCELQKVTPADSLSPMLQTLGTAMIKHYFNQPDAACQSIAYLLEHHQQELDGGSALNMAYILGVNLSRQGMYKDAAKLTQSLADQLKAQQVDSNQVAGLQKVANMYEMYADIGNICRPLHPVGEYKIPLFTDNKLHGKKDGFIAMNGHLNQTPKQLIFDTGAGMNIISSKDAKECGLRALDSYIDMAGTGIQQGQVAIADTLRIGETMWQNVPFLIVDIVTGHAEADKVMAKGLAPVIGLPVMLQMKEMQLDFVNHTLTIPANLTPNPLLHSNMMRKDNEGLRVVAYNEQGEPLYLHLDTGSSISMMTPRWYNNHKDLAQSTGVQDSLRLGGVGGVVQQHSYLMKNLGFQIGKGKAFLDSIQAGTGIDLHTGQPIVDSPFTDLEEDGVIGVDLLEKFARVIINLQDMFIEAIPRLGQK